MSEVPFTTDQIIARCRAAQKQAIASHSREAISNMFKSINEYFKTRISDRVAQRNWALFWTLWDAHFDQWYIQFQNQLNKEQEEQCKNNQNTTARATF